MGQILFMFDYSSKLGRIKSVQEEIHYNLGQVNMGGFYERKFIANV